MNSVSPDFFAPRRNLPSGWSHWKFFGGSAVTLLAGFRW
jgi:hypothetical protein